MPDGAALITAMTALALVDSINPTVTVAHIWLLMQTRSARVGWLFPAGVFAANFGAGVAVLAGASALPGAPKLVEALLWLVGVGLIVAAAVAWLAPHPPPLRRFTWSAFQAGGLAAGMTLLEFPTAAPYFSALALVGAKGLPLETQYLLLVYYNILFVLPLIALCILVGVNSVKRECLEQIRLWVLTKGRKGLAMLLAIFGACFLLRALSK